jgi:predicted nucleic acid-binding Zn ribbon protein
MNFRNKKLPLRGNKKTTIEICRVSGVCNAKCVHLVNENRHRPDLWKLLFMLAQIVWVLTQVIWILLNYSI